MILGCLAETNLWQALLSHGTRTVFVPDPLSLTLLMMSPLSLTWPLIGPRLARRVASCGEDAALAAANARLGGYPATVTSFSKIGLSPSISLRSTRTV